MDNSTLDQKINNITETLDNKITLLGRKIEGFDTSTKFLIGRLNHNIVEARIQFASNEYKAFENKVDKIAHRIDLLEQKLLHIWNNK